MSFHTDVSQKKNIVFVAPSMGFAGVGKMISFIANQLSSRGHKVSLINLNTTTKLMEQTISDAINVCNLDGNVRGLRRFLCVSEIVPICKKHNADIVIGFTEIPSMLAALVGLRLGIPSIMSERGDPARTGMGKGFKNRVVLEIINRSKGGVFQTDGARSFYGKGLQKRGVVIPNPIFIKGEIPQVAHAEREKTVVSVGRLDIFQKRYDVMLKAFALFSEKHPEYTLKLYGKGGDENLIRQWVTEMGLEEKVRFMGLTTQPMQDIARDGMFLITSDFEGISNSLLEAMAVGLPCVSTDHTPGGARLLITDHENGLLAPVEDAEALAHALCEFAENPQLAEKCGNNAKTVTTRFAPERIIDLWEEYILKLTQ